ncbi:sialoadhesin-like isoform X5 [Xyrauchen texanus]|uniref:sialoadhesin-like isoform X5 n=1 Tax=Xyrauchen texanus TaxID=154827 RepID=UPI002241A9F7|nr:sialoadhesin-like isoform X5 [Xyrauchen texanus]
MKGHLVLPLLFQVILLYDSLAWEVRIPKEIHGLKGSCLVIPCSFKYTSDPPTNPNRVVWYQWVSNGYPLVYDPLNTNQVIDKFKGKTDLYGDPSKKDCSLRIQSLEMSHNGEKIYTWIDPENVGYKTYKFYDVTSTILVDSSPEQPSINIYGGERVGEKIIVACATFHTCPYSEPKISLNGIKGSDLIERKDIKDGLWKITLTRTGVVKAESTDIECSVTYNGGIIATATKNQNAKCVHYNITIEPELADVTENITKIFICTVYHSCQKENPTITWNYENMQVSKSNKKLSGLDRATLSTITFLGTKNDHGKKLTCTAKFSGGDFTQSVVLRVQGIDLKTIWPYVIVPSLVILIGCLIAGLIIYKRQHRLPPEDIQGSQTGPRQRSSNVFTVSENEPFSKPRIPSPKSQQKSCSGYDYEADYTNISDMNVYGNV